MMLWWRVLHHAVEISLPRARIDLARRGAGSAAIRRARRVPGGPVATKRRAQLIKEIFWTPLTLTPAASADGDIGRSSQLGHSKELDLKFSELYWSSFLDSVQKKTSQKQNGSSFFVCFRTKKSTSARKSAFHCKVATNDRCSFIRRT